MKKMQGCKIDTENICISVKDAGAGCSYALRPGQRFLLPEIISDGLCLLAFHTFFPYYLTLINGGWFDWVSPGKGVFVHCPYPDGIAVKIYKHPQEGVFAQVVHTTEDCLFSYPVGKKFRLGDYKFCPRALDALYPNLLEIQEETLFLNCPSYNNHVGFAISKMKENRNNE